MRVLEKLLKIGYYFLGSIEWVRNVWFIARIKVLAGHAFRIYIDLVFPGLFRRKVIGIHLEFGYYSQVL
jgi:hypothetical protein